jgi:hypothetical protein
MHAAGRRGGQVGGCGPNPRILCHEGKGWKVRMESKTGCTIRHLVVTAEVMEVAADMIVVNFMHNVGDELDFQ